jgi:hypothetical protein
LFLAAECTFGGNTTVLVMSQPDLAYLCTVNCIGPSSQGPLTAVNLSATARNGRPLSDHVLGSLHAQVSSLGVITTEDKAEQQLYLLVSPASSPEAPPPVTLLPHTPAGLQHLTKASSKAAVGSGGRFFWSLQAAEGSGERASLAGYVLGVQQQQVTAREAWRVLLPGRVLASVSKDLSVPMYSAVKVRQSQGLGFCFVISRAGLGRPKYRHRAGGCDKGVLCLDLVCTCTGSPSAGVQALTGLFVLRSALWMASC